MQICVSTSIVQFLDVLLYLEAQTRETDFQEKAHVFFCPPQVDANLSFRGRSILSQWGNLSEADITGRSARRSSEQRHKEDHYVILSLISPLISQATAVATAKETSDVRVGS